MWEIQGRYRRDIGTVERAARVAVEVEAGVALALQPLRPRAVVSARHHARAARVLRPWLGFGLGLGLASPNANANANPNPNPNPNPNANSNSNPNPNP